MNAGFHRFGELFEQLGLAADQASIRAFITRHAPLPPHVRLADAPCWNPAQRQLLHESICHDADWADVVDRLDAALRAA